MNKWWLNICGILLLTLSLQKSYTMEERSPNENDSCSATLSHLPTELKTLIIEHSVYDYVNQNFDISDLENLEQNLCNTIKGFPAYLRQNLNWQLVSKEFSAIGPRKELDYYFKYYLTLKISQLDIDIRKNLLATIKMDKQCCDLIVTLLILSTVDNTLESFSKFKNAYNLMKQAIACRSIYFCRPLNGKDGDFFSDFHYAGIINFDPSKFRDSKLLQFFLNDREHKEDNELIFDIYEIIICLESTLKKELLEIAVKHDSFKKKYLDTEIAQAIYFQNLDKLKELLTSGSEINENCTMAGLNPLRLAVVFEVEKIIKYLLDNPQCTITGKYKRDTLYYAAASHNPEIIQLILDRDIHLKLSLSDFLIAAILTDNIRLFNLITDGKSIPRFACELDVNFKFAMDRAAQTNRVFMFQHLRKIGVDQDKDSGIYLEAAIENNCAEMARLLVDTHIHPYWIYTTSLPFAITRDGDLFKLQLLINLGLDVGLKNKENQTPLIMAHQNGYTEMVALLEQWSQAKTNHTQEKPKESKRCVIS